MPKDAYFDASDIASETQIPGPHAALTTSAPTPDDRARGWSSALFPVRPATPDNTPTDVQNGDETVEQRPSPCLAAAAPSPGNDPVDSMFVPRSSARRPWWPVCPCFAEVPPPSHVGRGGQGVEVSRPTNRPTDQP